jgi:hypothetical protein
LGKVDETRFSLDAADISRAANLPLPASKAVTSPVRLRVVNVRPASEDSPEGVPESAYQLESLEASPSQEKVLQPLFRGPPVEIDQSDVCQSGEELMVLRAWLADRGSTEDGIIPIRQPGRLEQKGVRICVRCSGIIQIRAILHAFGGPYEAFDHNLRIGGDFEFDGFAFHQSEWLSLKAAGEFELIYPGDTGGGSHHCGFTHADGHSHGQRPAHLLRLGDMETQMAVGRSAHARLPGVEEFHAIHANIAKAILGISGDVDVPCS